MYRLKRESKGDGYGLGLSMVKAICEIHNGELIIKNKENKKNGLVVGIKFRNQAT
jgi:nitrogen fixation/metabolism regulation signal transduction histidine kinase